MKRTAVINDLSCVGKCSLTVSIPILSSMGIEVCPVPTAVLSAHTEFPNPTFRDLSDDIVQIVRHWHSLGVQFQTVYSGYLSGIAQIDMVCDIFDTFDKDVLRLVDPVMGDNGKLYSKFTNEYPAQMLRLCKKADVIVPNVTEACAMCGIDYHFAPYTHEEIIRIINALREHTKAKIVLTGVGFCGTEVGVAVWDGNEIYFHTEEKVEGHFSGTGDIFASVLLGGLMNDKSLIDSAKFASHFTATCIRNTLRYEERERCGVMFEECLTQLF